VDSILSVYCGEGVLPEEWDIDAMTEYFNKVFLPKNLTLFKGMDITRLNRETAKQHILEMAHGLYQKKEEEIESVGQSMREIERILLLRVVDQKWMAHIDAMDQLRQGIGLRAYGQRDPIIEYRREGFDMFEEMICDIQQDTVTMLFHVKVTTKPERREAPKEITPPPKKALDSSGNKVGRNAPCPCGSGKKYKNCCGKEQLS
jgi:preprotein translocase subunit SecA